MLRFGQRRAALGVINLVLAALGATAECALVVGEKGSNVALACGSLPAFGTVVARARLWESLFDGIHRTRLRFALQGCQGSEWELTSAPARQRSIQYRCIEQTSQMAYQNSDADCLEPSKLPLNLSAATGARFSAWGWQGIRHGAAARLGT